MKRILVALMFAFCVAPAQTQSLTATEVRTIAKDAYIYGFPLVDNYRIQYSYFVDRGNPEFKGAWNEVHNTARVYTPDDKTIQSPNSETPYSFVGADLRAEPLVFTVPAIEQNRYYSLQFIDMYTFNFAYVGSRATGNAAGSYLLAGPGWNGEKPDSIKEVLRSETDFAFVIYRTQLFDPPDIDNLKRIQAGYKVQPLSQFLGKPAPAAAAAIDFIKPLTAEQQRSSLEFFNLLSFVLQFCPVHPSEAELRARFSKLGIGGGKPFDSQQLMPDVRKAVLDGVSDAWKDFGELKDKIDKKEVVSGDVVGNREYLKDNYLYRMAAAVLGIYGNSKEEAYYPSYFLDSQGQKLVGSQRYVLRFPEGELPPVNAFWSLTLYELPASLLYANPLNRYLVNSPMLADLKRDADGGISIYVQHRSPGKDVGANWLPAPSGPFFLAMRLYWPKAETLNGQWSAPPLQRMN
jgi:hypothetical protein